MAVPPIARPTDTPLARLTAAELFLITSTRLWVTPYRHPSAILPHWREGFACVRLDQEASDSFDTLIRIVAASSRRALDIRWHCCPLLGEAESRLLHCLALWQRRRLDDSYEFLARWLSPPAARVALDPGERLAGALLRAALVVPLGRPGDADHALDEYPLACDQRSRLVH